MTERHIAIDLSRHHFMRPIGDMVLFGTWVFNSDQEADEPALVIVPRYRRRGYKPAVIALSSAYRYNTDARYTVAMAREFAIGLGLSDSMADCHKILTLIHDHLGDLIGIPPNPTDTIVVGEARVDWGDGTKRTIELLDYEPTKQV
jgi:hypothetical protein